MDGLELWDHKDKETRLDFVKSLLKSKCIPGPLQEQALLRVFEGHTNLIQCPGELLKATTALTHTIAYDGPPSVYVPQYKTAKCDEEEVDAEVTRLLNEDLIEFSSCDFNSPLLPVRKKSGKLRFCLDLRAVNRHILKMRWPLPNINDMLSRLKGATTFCVLDLKSAFN